jgi:hypothetical protein
MGLWVRPTPRGGFAPPFPRSALGVHPEDPFRVAQRLALDPSRWSAVEGGCPLQRRVWCRASQDIPPARGSPGRGGRWRPPVLTSGPGTTREAGLPPPYRAGPAGSRPVAQATSISPPLSLPNACNQGLLQAHPLTEASPDNGGPDPPPPGHPPRPPPPGAPPLSGERSPLTKPLAEGSRPWWGSRLSHSGVLLEGLERFHQVRPWSGEVALCVVPDGAHQDGE